MNRTDALAIINAKYNLGLSPMTPKRKTDVSGYLDSVKVGTEDTLVWMFNHYGIRKNGQYGWFLKSGKLYTCFITSVPHESRPVFKADVVNDTHELPDFLKDIARQKLGNYYKLIDKYFYELPKGYVKYTRVPAGYQAICRGNNFTYELHLKGNRFGEDMVRVYGNLIEGLAPVMPLKAFVSFLQDNYHQIIDTMAQEAAEMMREVFKDPDIPQANIPHVKKQAKTTKKKGLDLEFAGTQQKPKKGF